MIDQIDFAMTQVKQNNWQKCAKLIVTKTINNF